MKRKRIAVIERELCNPKLTGYACMKACPVNRTGKDCITVWMDKKPIINEELCIGCGICQKKCFRNAIDIVNLPEQLQEEPIHRYGRNAFMLFRLPIPQKNAVIGLIGPNGVGKSTVLNIFSGKIKPNTGLLESDVPWDEIIKRFRGTELQEYLKRLSKKEIRVGYKPQHVDLIPKMYRGRAADLLKKTDENGMLEETVKRLGISGILEKNVGSLSGGELQLFAIAAVLLKDADFYFFDEPSSYLDVYERMLAAKEIRRLAEKAVVMVVEHDLAVADYLADYVHILYGRPGAFGVVSRPYAVRVGINTYLEGFIREENMRFRAESIKFDITPKRFEKTALFLEFPGFEKKFEGFELKTEGGELYKGEIIGILGPNATGKTTFIKMLSGELEPDKTTGDSILGSLKLSCKPQRLLLKKEQEAMTLREFLKTESEKSFSKEGKSIMRILGLEKLLERTMGSLSGGELQSAMITAALTKPCDLMLLDEPSAFLDVEQRLRVARLLRTITESKEIPCFVVDHDLQFIDVLSDRIMLFEGEQGVRGFGNSPAHLKNGMNRFLKALNMTFRRDPQTGRPRANKPGSQKDSEQKEKGEYYYMG